MHVFIVKWAADVGGKCLNSLNLQVTSPHKTVTNTKQDKTEIHPALPFKEPSL